MPIGLAQGLSGEIESEPAGGVGDGVSNLGSQKHVSEPYHTNVAQDPSPLGPPTPPP